MSDAAVDARLAAAVAEAFGPNATVRVADRLHGDASSRTYVRLHMHGAPVATAVAMLLPPGPPRSDEVGHDAASPTLPFVDVATYLARHGFRIPTIYADASAQGLLLVEDIGDVSLWRAVDTEPTRAVPLFAEAVDVLVRLQATGTRHPDAHCVAFQRRFDAALARAELVHFVDHGIDTRRGRPLAPSERADVLAAVEPLTRPFADGPMVLAHRDYMAWNVHVHPATGELVLIDFQDALLAPDAFDLAQLLTDRTTITRLERRDRDALVDRFEAARDAAGLSTPPGLRERVDVCALQHALKVIGRFHYLELVVGKPGYLAYLPAVYAVAREALGRLADGATMTTALGRWAPELAAGA